MAVTYVGKGTFQTGRDALTVPIPTGISVGDLLLLIIQRTAYTETPTDISGWTTVDVGEEIQVTSVQVVYKFAVEGEGSATIPYIANSTRAIMSAWRGVDEATPINAWLKTTLSLSGSTSYSRPNPSSTVDGCMLVNCIGFWDQDSDDTSNFTSWANTSLVSITEGHDESTATGSGGGLAFAYGIKTTAGAINDTTATVDYAVSYHSVINLLLSPVQPKKSSTFFMFL